MSQRTYVVAELGPSFVYGADLAVNERTLLRLLDIAADAGADCVKLQCKGDGFYAGDDMSRPPHDAARAPFATRGEYVSAREPDARLLALTALESKARGLEWSASPWDAQSVELLASIGVPWVKVASACITDLPLLDLVRQMGVPIVLSTGGATVAQIDAAVNAIGAKDLTLAVCTMAYPADAGALHLARIGAMQRRYGVPIGWSSHSPDPDHGAAAVHSGAVWFETHITTGKLRWGPDHLASLDPESFRRCVWQVREAERVRGDATIGVLPCEERAVKRLRRTA